MSMYCQDLGERGELYAMRYLRHHGFSILEHHFTTHWGELDIIARKDNKIYFIEVKTRVGDGKGKGYEAVGYYKVKSLMRAIQFYLTKYRLKGFKYSLDIISITVDRSYEVEEFKYYDNVLLDFSM